VAEIFRCIYEGCEVGQASACLLLISFDFAKSVTVEENVVLDQKEDRLKPVLRKSLELLAECGELLF
jgi:hypothetical protein